MTKEAKTQIVIDNYFKSECDVNTSIRKAFEKGFRIGVQKGSVVAEPVKHGHWVHGKELSRDYVGDVCSSIHYDGWWCSECGYHFEGKPLWKYCPHCGSRNG